MFSLQVPIKLELSLQYICVFENNSIIDADKLVFTVLVTFKIICGR